ncbi:MAG: IS200/IS605 family transposase [Candidatus Aenigmatarchaeota archaeon]
MIQSKILHKIFKYEPARRLCEHIFRNVANEMKIDIQELGFDKDHVHMIVDIGLYSVIDVAKKLKGVSDYKLLRTFKLMKKYFWGSGFWSPAVYFDSVGNNAPVVRKYVKCTAETDSILTVQMPPVFDWWLFTTILF